MSSAEWTLWIPAAAGVLMFLSGRRARPPWGVLAALATTAAAATLALDVWSSGPVEVAVGGWAPPLGIALRADGLSAVMIAMVAAVGLPVSIYAAAYFRPEGEAWSERMGFWPAWLLLWAALNALFLSADLFNLYVVLELMGLSAVSLVALAGGRLALGAALRYLFATLLGSLSYLLGVALVYGAFHTLDLGLLSERMAAGPAPRAALAVMTVGLLIKTAIFPLHFWLPGAHASAPAPVSAILSGLVVKASFYLLIRLWLGPFAPVIGPAAAQLLGALGAAAIFWGSLQAIRQERLKLLVAHSTVAQLGYLLLLVPLAMPALHGAPSGPGLDAWRGTIYQALSHALAKAATFLSAGALTYAVGGDRLSELRGVAARLPVVVFAFSLAAMSLIGLPPSAGFVAKWHLLGAAIATAQWWWAAAIIAGGLLAAAYLFIALRAAFLSPAGEAPARPVPAALQAAPLGLALMSLLLGLRATEPLALLLVGNPFLRLLER